VFIAIFWQEINIETATRGGESVSGRLVAWRAAAEGIQHHWLLGVGLRQGVSEIVKHIDYEWLLVASRRTPVDNSYLSMFLEEGVIGFGLMLAAMVLIIKDGLSASVFSARRRPEAVAALASIAALLLNGLTFDALLIWPNFLIFWTAAGMLRGASLAGVNEGTSAAGGELI
jgi:O-antigen ligase